MQDDTCSGVAGKGLPIAPVRTLLSGNNNAYGE